jgi:hypothetical protein
VSLSIAIAKQLEFVGYQLTSNKIKILKLIKKKTSGAAIAYCLLIFIYA